MRIVHSPSPNFGPRRGTQRPSLVVLHYTAMASAEAALERLCSAAHEVSAHYLIGACGRVWRLVDEGARAWHAGAGAWGSVGDVNSHSVGIEIDNPGDAPFAEPAMAALLELLPQVLARHGLGPEAVIGHSDMAPGRKIDPGPRFDWPRLARAGLAVWPEAAGQGDPAGFAADARAFGYRGEPASVLAAFRARFRPGAAGLPGPDATDAGIIAALARAHPFIDPGPAGA